VAMMGRGVMIEPEPGPGAETREAGE